MALSNPRERTRPLECTYCSPVFFCMWIDTYPSIYLHGNVDTYLLSQMYANKVLATQRCEIAIGLPRADERPNHSSNAYIQG
jgi:hypothetical protein